VGNLPALRWLPKAELLTALTEVPMKVLIDRSAADVDT